MIGVVRTIAGTVLVVAAGIPALLVAVLWLCSEVYGWVL